MFREGGNKAVGPARAEASWERAIRMRAGLLPALSVVVPRLPAVLDSPMRASRAIVPLLLAEAAAFALVSGSGKIPAFLFTALRALLAF